MQAVGNVQASAPTARLEWLIVIDTLGAVGAVAKVARRCGAVSGDIQYIQYIQYIQEPLSHAVCSKNMSTLYLMVYTC